MYLYEGEARCAAGEEAPVRQRAQRVAEHGEVVVGEIGEHIACVAAGFQPAEESDGGAGAFPEILHLVYAGEPALVCIHKCYNVDSFAILRAVLYRGCPSGISTGGLSSL